VLAFPGPGVPQLSERPLIAPDQAAEVADLFKVLASDTRLRLLHAIARGGEVRAGELAAAVGMTQQAVSNQLQRLVDRRICATRRAGTAILYRIIDPCVVSLLNYGVCLAEPPCAVEGT
jgi:ArsR family transcriptional regulator, lead/cadmium/zinc/bismuth-responsive transcriptional repressor